MEPAFFSTSDLFGAGDSDEDVSTDVTEALAFVEREHPFPGIGLHIREFSFHEVNANLLWPGTFTFAQWLVDHRNLLEGRRILELGSGTGALTIFLRKALGLDLTTSDYDDEQIENNIAYNLQANGEATLQHIRHTWGQPFPIENPYWDLVIASDILLYVKQYPNLVKTLCHLLRRYAPENGMSCRKSPSPTKPARETVHTNLCNSPLGSIEPSTESIPKQITAGRDANCRSAVTTGVEQLPKPCFLMSWRRRIPKQDEALFFEGCKKLGLQVADLGSRVYCISC